MSKPTMLSIHFVLILMNLTFHQAKLAQAERHLPTNQMIASSCPADQPWVGFVDGK